MSERRASLYARLRLGVLGALWLSVSIAALLMPGCYGRNCEPSVEQYDTATGTGFMLDANKWVSSPINGDWLPFPRQRSWVFDIPELGGRTPEVFTAYISAVKNPSLSGDLTTASGNLAKFIGPRPNGINVFNDSCSDYYLRLVLEVPALPPQVGPSDGGTDVVTPDAGSTVDASESDAGDGG